MKNHKDYGIVELGGSDIASLILRFCDHICEIHFGEDGSYHAYVVDEECSIPADYRLISEGMSWLWIYDDTEKVAEIRGKVIKVFHNNSRYHCIIQTID